MKILYIPVHNYRIKVLGQMEYRIIKSKEKICEKIEEIWKF